MVHKQGGAEPKVRRRALWALLVCLPFLGACSTLEQFGPSVKVQTVSPGQYIAIKRGDILTTGKLSVATRDTIRMAGLDEDACATPSPSCITAMHATILVPEEDKRSALAELWVQHATSLPPPRMNDQPSLVHIQHQFYAWMEVAREAYAYLFFTERSATERAFVDRQTQVRDYYNLAVQEVATLLFRSSVQYAQSPSGNTASVGAWNLVVNAQNIRLPADARVPTELLSASSLAFEGRLRSVHRRDGFGAELVAVVDPPATKREGTQAGPVPTQQDPDWSEMPSPSVSALMTFPGKTLHEVLTSQSPDIVVYDPYKTDRVEIQGQQIPLAANFTAGYGLWLARSGFSKQSIESLLGRQGGIERPHLYLMQPFDPNRRIILMIHGLASSPEAWVNVANELLSDDQVREHYQIWQIYYPTNLPIPYNHYAMRQTYLDALAHFDPTSSSRASREMVVIGHSMGGVMTRLMMSSSGSTLWDALLAGRHVEPEKLQRIKDKIGPMLHFEPLPQIGRVIFIATPHRGTELASKGPGRLLSKLVKIPSTLLEGFSDVVGAVLDGPATGPNRQIKPRNSIDQLDKSDPFVLAASALPLSKSVPFHSIIAQDKAATPLQQSTDGLVPYQSSHLDGAASEKVIISGHSVQETTPAIVEVRRILHEDMLLHGEISPP